MKNIVLIIGLVIISTVTFLNAEIIDKCSPQLPSQSSNQSNTSDESKLRLEPDEIKNISSLQIPFIKNEGQVKSQEVKFYTKTLVGNVFITDKGELIYNVLYPRDYIGADTVLFPNGSPQPLAFFIKEKPLNTQNTGINVEGLERAETVINSFVGPKEDWRTNISTYNLITLGDIWEGITFNLKANQKNIEKLFVVHPDGNVDSIRFAVEGIKTLSLKESGDLELIASQGNTKFTRPIAYQDIPARTDGRSGGNDVIRKYIDVSYLIIDDSTYGFKIGNYDHSVPLIIDPLLLSTYCGGNGEDVCTGVIRDNLGFVFTVGYTNSFNIPYPGTIAPTFQPSLNYTAYLLYDVFISEFSPGLTTVWSSTYLGSSYASEFGAAIALDTAQNIYVTGTTNNIIATGRLPPDTLQDTTINGVATAAGIYDSSFNGGTDVFVARLSTNGSPNYNITTLNAFTYLGGTGNDYGCAIKVDNNIVFVAGIAGNSTFPATRGADTTFGGGYDGFIARFNNGLTTAGFACSYVGGLSNDFCHGLAVADTARNIIVTGNTFSSDFPTTTDTYRASLSGNSDAFITRFSNGLTSIINSTLIGGTGLDVAYAIATDSVNNIYVIGETQSSDFPVSCTALSTYSGAGDVFITKFNSGLTNTLASRFIGGSNRDVGYALILSGTVGPGQVFLYGYTSSMDFPTSPAILPPYSTTLSGSSDAFITRLDSNTFNLEASTYIGGSGSELNSPNPDLFINGAGIIIDTAPLAGAVTVVTFVGSTNSSDFPLVNPLDPNRPVPYDSNYNGTVSNGGASDTFIGRMMPDLGRLPLSIPITAVLPTSLTQATIRSPSNGAIDQIIPSVLQWDPPSNAGSTIRYAVYLSSVYSPQVEIYSGALTSYLPAPETFEEGTTYDWQVVSVDDYYVDPITFTRISWSNLARFTTAGWRPGPEPVITSTDDAGSSGDPFAPADAFTKELGTCFIATAVYGSPMHPNVVTLRNFRDKYLLTNTLGSKFVKWYYKVSPGIAEHIKHSTLLAIICRLCLSPFVYSLRYPISIGIFLIILSIIVILHSRKKITTIYIKNNTI
ncbi:MAG: CFI-box-CTERM domain-containing protein [Planctomycetota bacterium]